MSYLEMTEEELHDCVERGGLDDDMFFSLHEEATEEIKRLEHILSKLMDKARSTLCSTQYDEIDNYLQTLENCIP